MSLFFGNKTPLIVTGNLLNGLLCLIKHLLLLGGNRHIRNGNSHRCLCRVLVSHCLDIVKNFRGLGCTMVIDDFFKDLLEV